ncbi:G-patch domain [Sesbania bispinosa]|nr:G-patch domain [Sesbania bispinosa]
MYPHHQAQAPQGVQWPLYGLPPGVQWPTYGLPPGYTPPQLTNPQDNNTTAANTDPQNQAQQLDPGQTTNETSAPPPPFPTFMPYPFLPTTNTPPNTFQPQNFYLDSQGKPIIPQLVPLLVSTTQPKDTVVNDPHSKEKLQILEDRLRAIEGAGNNPLPGHGASGSGINMLEDFSGHVLVRDVTDIKTPMESIFEELCKVGAIEKKGDSRKGAMCAIHPDISCERDEMGVNVVQESENAQTQVFPKVPTPLTLHGTHNTQAPTYHGPRPITIQVPSPFPYKNSKAVPWKYDVQVRVGDVQGNRVDPSIGHGAPTVTNISSIGGMTRSGRIYTPKELQETFEIANASYAKEGAPIVGPHLSRASMMIAKIMLEKGYQHGQGLGKTTKGVADVMRLGENKDKFGLGYKATPADRKRVAEEKKEKRLARLENREPVTRGIPICNIRQSFRSAGFMFDNQVAVIEEEDTPARIRK